MKTLLLIIILIASGSAYSEEVETPKEKVNSFFGELVFGASPSRAYDTLFAGSNLLKLKPEAVGLLKKQTKTVASVHGDFIGYELIYETKLSPSLIRLVYLLKAEEHPITWEFYFYKPRDEWYLASINFNDQFMSLD